MGQGGHLAAQGAAGHLVIQGSLCCSHGIVAAAMRKVGNGFNHKLVVSRNQVVKGNTRLVGNKLCRILGAEIPPDSFNACP